MNYSEVLNFWFDEIEPKSWWQKSNEFDRLITERFGHVHTAATLGELYEWRVTPKGRLAEIIVLDQFSRNIYRNNAKSFLFDTVALVLSQEAINCGDDKKLETHQRLFLYMPFMHSESKVIHEKAVELFSEPGLEGNLDFEMRHKAIIDRFGRYPHRNIVLGRESTAEEVEFLQEPGSSF
ncbi:DUF924 family protein [Pleionea sediminis]|uniref:DUF924 family protein n=1 Tax=Pleionea sediminis TaxID=2569479 RepID=UPI0011862566|nr:DUF924 family protein [Pleionea sediminis]